MNKIVKIVKKKLWTFGYSVKDFTGVDAVKFDLLVENKYKVLVGEDYPESLPKGCDVYAIVRKDEVTFITNNSPEKIEHSSPYKVFGKKE